MSFCGGCGSSLVADSAFCNQCGRPVNSQTTTATGAAVQPAKNVERKFFEDGNVLVTNTRFVRGNETFAMAGVTSVKSFTEVPSKKGPIIIIVIGSIIIFGSLQSSLGGVLFGAALVVAGILWLRSIKNVYHVRLVTASSERDAISNTDSGYINNIVNAINEAIVHRG
jgi:hypothetical protein